MLKTLSISQQVSKSVSYFFRSFQVIRKARMRWVYLTPIAIYFILFILGFSLTNDLHGLAMEYVQSWLADMIEDSSWLSGLGTATSVFTWIIIKVSLFILFAIFSGYITLILLAPLLTYLSEKVDEIETGVVYPFDLVKFFKDIWRAVLVALRNGISQLVLTVLILIMGLIPVVNLLSAPLLFVVSAYFYGFSFLDYNYERFGLSMREGVTETRRLKWVAIALGALFLLANMIPWIGVFISTLVIFPLVVTASLVAIELKELSSKN